MTAFLTGPTMQHASLLLLRVTTAGLMFWWGLAKAMNTGVGQGVSNKYYAGAFTQDLLLTAFGGAQAVAAVLIALGAFRGILLPFQFAVNLFVAIVVWQSIADPFWMWMGGEQPETVNTLFYPSAVVAAASLVLIALRRQDRWAVMP
ncbi:MAG: hypothetical protein AAF415_08705 [Pseudomonadota bacterium]